MDIRNIFRNISPAVAVMVVGVLGAYLVYDNYFSNDTAAAIGAVEPAAGDEAAAPVADTADAAAPAADETAAVPAGDAMPAPAPVKTDENGCLLDDAGKTTLDEAGNCVKPAPAPVAAPAAGDAGVEAMPPTEGEEAAPAKE